MQCARRTRHSHAATPTRGPSCKFLPRAALRPQGPHLPEIEEHTQMVRVFRNYAGGYRPDGTDGSDMEAVAAGWASVTPLGLRSDLLFKVGRGLGAVAGWGAGVGGGRRAGARSCAVVRGAAAACACWEALRGGVERAGKRCCARPRPPCNPGHPCAHTPRRRAPAATRA